MMNYEEFKQKVQNEFKNYLGEEYKDAEVFIREVTKVNMQVDQMSLLNLPGNDFASPSISLQSIFENYEKTGDFEGVMEALSETFKEAIEGFEKSPLNNGLDFSNVDKNIIFTLVNAEQNKELLENVPHRKFEDLAIIYRWNVGVDSNGLYTNIVTNEFAEKIGKSEEELYGLAKENTNRIFPSEVRNMAEVISEIIFGEDGELMPEDEEFRNMMIETPDDKSMYVITNKSKLFGAAAMLYEENLYDLSQQLDSDLYILPSSTHEVIAISDKFGDANELADMVYEINMDQVDLSDRLSNQVYHYDKEARTLRLATNKFERTISDDIKEKTPEIKEGKAR